MEMITHSRERVLEEYDLVNRTLEKEDIFFCDLLQGLLRNADRFTAERAAKHNFFTDIFLSKDLEVRLTIGIVVPEYLPHPGAPKRLRPVKPLLLKRFEKGIEVECCVDEGYQKNEILLWATQF